MTGYAKTDYFAQNVSLIYTRLKPNRSSWGQFFSLYSYFPLSLKNIMAKFCAHRCFVVEVTH